jgi:hypothetical protein
VCLNEWNVLSFGVAQRRRRWPQTGGIHTAERAASDTATRPESADPPPSARRGLDPFLERLRRKRIAAEFGYSEATVAAWLHAAHEKGIASKVRGDAGQASRVVEQDGRAPEEILAAWGARSL